VARSVVLLSDDDDAFYLSECSSNDVAGLKQCLDAGVDPSAANGIGQSGLHVSCIWGNHHCVQVQSGREGGRAGGREGEREKPQ
jgi:hypothetical protein